MVPEVARAHAEAMRNWATEWEGCPAPGASEVGFLLRRAATMAEGAMGLPTQPDARDAIAAAPPPPYAPDPRLG